MKGKVQATKYRQPVELIYYKECNSRPEAFRLEMKFKNGKTRKSTIDKLINSFSKTKCQGFNSHLHRRETEEIELRKIRDFS